jgi:hypothetical protein
MIRYTLLALAIAATGATAIADTHRATTATDSPHLTVIFKNQAFPVLGPLVVTPCATEDCSDVQS